MTRLALFDLDHTLLDGDSDELWCDFLIAQGLLDGAAFAPRNAALQAGYRAGSVGVAAFCGFYAALLAGRSFDGWRPLLERFLHERVAPRLRPAGRAAVRAHAAAGDRVVMTTATNRALTVLTAAELGIAEADLIATELGCDAQGRYDGTVAGTPNMRQGKVERLAQWLAGQGIERAGCTLVGYSDSANDLPLLHAVDRAVVVNGDAALCAHAARHGWAVVDWSVAAAAR